MRSPERSTPRSSKPSSSYCLDLAKLNMCRRRMSQRLRRPRSRRVLEAGHLQWQGCSTSMLDLHCALLHPTLPKLGRIHGRSTLDRGRHMRTLPIQFLVRTCQRTHPMVTGHAVTVDRLGRSNNQLRRPLNLLTTRGGVLPTPKSQKNFGHSLAVMQTVVLGPTASRTTSEK